MIRYQGLDYKVRLVSNTLNSSNIGICDLNNCELHILSEDVDSQKQHQVFWHEVEHLLTEEEEFYADEPVIVRLGNRLFSFLQDNNLLREDWWERVVDRE